MTDLQAATGTSHFVEANGVRFHYLDYGSADQPPMLCLHGGAAHAHWFDFVAPGFTPDHHLLSLDLRGHGDSAWADPETYSVKTYAEDVHAIVEQLDLRDFVLIGHSMGGMVSLIYATTHPGRVSRLVIVDSTMLTPLENVSRMREFGARPPRRYATKEELVEHYRLAPAETHLAAPEVIQRMASHSARQDADGQWGHKADRRVYLNFQQIAGVPLWEKVKIPALVIRGQQSKRFSPEVLAEIQARAPQVQVAEVPLANHHITLDNPPGFVDVVRKFLQS